MPDLLPTDVALAPGDVALIAGDVTDAPDLLAGDEPDPPEGPCECCGGGAPCGNFGPAVCFTLSSAACPNLDGLQLTGAEVLPAGACRHWTYAGSPIVSGGCTFTINVDFYCGCADAPTAPPCPTSAEFSTCGYVTVGGTTNCGGGGTWRLVTAPDGTNPKLPVTWVASDPPFGIVSGYVVPGLDESDCSCPCTKNTLVTLTVQKGACDTVVVVDCGCFGASDLLVTAQDIDGCPCLDGKSGTVNKDIGTPSWNGDITLTPNCTPAAGAASSFHVTFACGENPQTSEIVPGMLFLNAILNTIVGNVAELVTYDLTGLGGSRPANARVVSFNCAPFEVVVEGTFRPSSDFGGFGDGTTGGCTNPRPQVRFIITNLP